MHDVTRRLLSMSMVAVTLGYLACDASAPPPATTSAPRADPAIAADAGAAPAEAIPADQIPAAPSAPVADAELPLAEPLRQRGRTLWSRNWTDLDRDCQDTRTEVLIAESEIPVTFADRRRCRVKAGRWTCPYTGKVITDPRDLDIDHTVPLGNARRAGGHAWSKARQRAYANDLTAAEHLVAVDRSANRSKGDQGPETWLPSEGAFRCTYVHRWIAIKRRWSLGAISEAERATLRTVLATCPASPLEPVPAPPLVEPTRVAAPERRAPKPKPKPTPKPAGTCCKQCTSGTACGDSCISPGRVCRQPPGCAC